MPTLVRLTAVWTGWAGAPGYSNFYARPGAVPPQDVADAFAEDIWDFFEALNGHLPSVVHVTIDPTWATIEESNGNLQEEGSLTEPPAPVVGTNVGYYAGNSGVAVDWHTGAFIAGHRLKGRTYLVPMASMTDSDGTLDPLPRQAVIDAATTLLSGTANMVVWHRPVNGAGGSASPVTSATVTDRAAVLRSRSV